MFVDRSCSPGSDLGSTSHQHTKKTPKITSEQFAIIAIPTQRESWLHKVAPAQISDLIAAEEHGNTGERHSINYAPHTNHYSNHPQVETDETTPLNPETRRALESGRTQVGTGLPGNVAMDAPATDEWARG